MTRPIVAAVLVLALSASLAGCSKSPEDILAKIVAKEACASQATAAGYVRKTAFQYKKINAVGVETVDAKSRRFRMVGRVWYTNSPLEYTVTVRDLSGGQARQCKLSSAAPAEPCKWSDPRPMTDDVSAAEAFVKFETYLTPDHGGAALAAEDARKDVQGATATLVMTPPGAAPVAFYVDSTGAVLGYQIRSERNVKNDVWQSYPTRKDFEGCNRPSTEVQVRESKVQEDLKSTITSFAYQAAIPEETFALDKPVAIP